MQGTEKNIVTLVKNILSPVAMMKIDIEDRNALCTLISQVLGGNRRIV